MAKYAHFDLFPVSPAYSPPDCEGSRHLCQDDFTRPMPTHSKSHTCSELHHVKPLTLLISVQNDSVSFGYGYSYRCESRSEEVTVDNSYKIEKEYFLYTRQIIMARKIPIVKGFYILGYFLCLYGGIVLAQNSEWMK